MAVASAWTALDLISVVASVSAIGPHTLAPTSSHRLDVGARLPHGPGLAEARRVRADTSGADESRKRAAVVGALLFGHKSSHRQGHRLTAAAGVEQRDPSVR
jgi:hypothetical protein